jgi:hypothetical protein
MNGMLALFYQTSEYFRQKNRQMYVKVLISCQSNNEAQNRTKLGEKNNACGVAENNPRTQTIGPRYVRYVHSLSSIR